MVNQIYPTLYRDFSTLLLRRRFWGLMAVWCALCGILFFAYFEDFLSIQPVLRAKNFRYGVTDLVIIPYIKTVSYFSIILMTALCARLGYLEHFSTFSSLYRSLPIKARHLITAKLLYITFLAMIAVLILALPMIVSGLFFHYDIGRVVVLLFGLFALLLSVGLLTLVFSQIIAHSVVVVLLTVLLIGITELAAKLLVEPAWLTPIIAFFSPISHLNRMANGVLTASDIIFYITLILLLIIIFIRQFHRTYFFSR